MADFSADHWMGPSEGVLIKANESRYPPLLHVGITRDGVQADHTTISTSDAHKLADWIKENVPEPSPAPPDWLVIDDDDCIVLKVDGASSAWMQKDGEMHDDGVRSIPGVTHELHKEMICALLDAHYELHKGES